VAIVVTAPRVPLARVKARRVIERVAQASLADTRDLAQLRYRYRLVDARAEERFDPLDHLAA
jgi:hypothetical protein